MNETTIEYFNENGYMFFNKTNDNTWKLGIYPQLSKSMPPWPLTSKVKNEKGDEFFYDGFADNGHGLVGIIWKNTKNIGILEKRDLVYNFAKKYDLYIPSTLEPYKF